MARGPLSLTEKYTIQGMVHDQKTSEEIAELLGRSVKVVSKYVDGELSDIHDTVTNVQMEKAALAEKLEEVEPVTRDEVERSPRATPEQDRIAKSRSKDLYVRRGASGKTRGVSVATPAASARGDAHHDNFTPPKSNTRGSRVWLIEEGKMDDK